MNQTGPGTRRVIGIVLILMGLLMVSVVPYLAQISLDLVLKNLTQAIQAKPGLASGPALFSLFFPLLRALIFVAGIGLLVIAYPLMKGEEWTYGVALLFTALPAIGGMFMFLPFISFVKDTAPLPLLISATGLAGYWTILLARKAAALERLARFVVFTLMGMSITHSLTIGVGCLRQLMTRPGHPFYADVTWWVLTITGEVVWIAALLLLISIPLLALRRRAAWWMTVIAASATLAVHVPTHLIRGTTTDYLVGALLAGGLLLFVTLPRFRRTLI